MLLKTRQCAGLSWRWANRSVFLLGGKRTCIPPCSDARFWPTITQGSSVSSCCLSFRVKLYQRGQSFSRRGCVRKCACRAQSLSDQLAHFTPCHKSPCLLTSPYAWSIVLRNLDACHFSTYTTMHIFFLTLLWLVWSAISGHVHCVLKKSVCHITAPWANLRNPVLRGMTQPVLSIIKLMELY